MQMEALESYAQQRGWEIVLRFEEVGSGANTRPKREKLLQAARHREIDVILVWKLDRWGRSESDLITTLQELDRLGVGFVSYTEALDLTTPTGRAMAGMIAIFAEFERSLLQERIKAGMDHARGRGKALGRPGLSTETQNRVKELAANGVSQRNIAKKLAISRGSVTNILKVDQRAHLLTQTAIPG